MGKRPVVGIVCKPLSDFECPGDVWVEDYVKDEFRAAVCRGGCVPIGVLPTFADSRYNADESRAVLADNLSEAEAADLDRVLGLCDGLILQGGMTADYYEYRAARYALDNGIPILGVCAGFNTLCRAAGADIVSAADLGLDPALHNVYSTTYRHEVSVRRGGLLHELFGRDALSVNSLHTQFLTAARARACERIAIEATASDVALSGEGVVTVEAFAVAGARFAVGVKWHPELMEREHQDVLFGCFLEACCGR